MNENSPNQNPAEYHIPVEQYSASQEIKVNMGSTASTLSNLETVAVSVEDETADTDEHFDTDTHAEAVAEKLGKFEALPNQAPVAEVDASVNEEYEEAYGMDESDLGNATDELGDIESEANTESNDDLAEYSSDESPEEL